MYIEKSSEDLGLGWCKSVCVNYTQKKLYPPPNQYSLCVFNNELSNFINFKYFLNCNWTYISIYSIWQYFQFFFFFFKENALYGFLRNIKLTVLLPVFLGRGAERERQVGISSFCILTLTPCFEFGIFAPPSCSDTHTYAHAYTYSHSHTHPPSSYCPNSGLLSTYLYLNLCLYLSHLYLSLCKCPY